MKTDVTDNVKDGNPASVALDGAVAMLMRPTSFVSIPRVIEIDNLINDTVRAEIKELFEGDMMNGLDSAVFTTIDGLTPKGTNVFNSVKCLFLTAECFGCLFDLKVMCTVVGK
jgi:hypothetical protein